MFSMRTCICLSFTHAAPGIHGAYEILQSGAFPSQNATAKTRQAGNSDAANHPAPRVAGVSEGSMSSTSISRLSFRTASAAKGGLSHLCAQAHLA